MTVVEVVAWSTAGLTAWLLAGAAAAVAVGKRIHRNNHRDQIANPRDCPPWCVAERAAALLRRQRGGAQRCTAGTAPTARAR